MTDSQECRDHWTVTRTTEKQIAVVEERLLHIEKSIEEIRRARMTLIEKILYPIITAGLVYIIPKLLKGL